MCSRLETADGQPADEAEAGSRSAFALVSIICAPAWTMDDDEIADCARLAQEYPEHADFIKKFT